jgi:hypothetical protein
VLNKELIMQPLGEVVGKLEFWSKQPFVRNKFGYEHSIV